MRILITGDRHWHHAELAERIVKRLLKRHGPDQFVVEGGATGVWTGGQVMWATLSRGMCFILTDRSRSGMPGSLKTTKCEPSGKTTTQSW